MVQQFAELCIEDFWFFQVCKASELPSGYFSVRQTKQKNAGPALYVGFASIISCNNETHRSYVPEAGFNQGQPPCYFGPCGALDWALK